jgi:hypothetical protein
MTAWVAREATSGTKLPAGPSASALASVLAFALAPELALAPSSSLGPAPAPTLTPSRLFPITSEKLSPSPRDSPGPSLAEGASALLGASVFMNNPSARPARSCWPLSHTGRWRPAFLTPLPGALGWSESCFSGEDVSKERVTV